MNTDTAPRNRILVEGREAHSGTTYIVVPTLDEAANLPELLARVDSAMTTRPYRVLVVDDGSTDGTQWSVGSLSRAGFPVELLERGARKGIGSAIRDGIVRCLSCSDARCIVTLDADLSHDPAEIPRLVDALGETDLAQGSRYVTGGRIENWGVVRRILSLAANAIVRVVFQTGSKEHTTYFRAYSRVAASAATRVDGCTGYDWAISSLLAVREAGLRVREVPIVFRGRNSGSSKLTPQAMFAWLSFVLLHGVVKRLQSENPARLPTFAAVGASGMAVNVLTLGALTGVIGVDPVFALALGIEASVIWNFMLNEHWTFRGRRVVGPRWGRLGKYHGVCAAGILLNLAVFAVLTFGLGVDYFVSNLVAIPVGFLANFFGSASWTWVGR